MAPPMAEVQLLPLGFMPVAVIGGLVLAYLLLLYPQTSKPDFWDSQPHVGLKDQHLYWLRSTLKSFTHAQSMVAEGYAKFSKSNIPFVQPSITMGPVIVVPPPQVRRILSMPESQVELKYSHMDEIQAPYTIRDPDVYGNPFQVGVVRRQLSREIPSFTGDFAEEIGSAIQQYWGTSSDWNAVKVWETTLKIVTRASNRVFVGVPLCRNEKFLEHSRRYSMAIFGGGKIINMFPTVLKPIIGPLVGLVSRKHLGICTKICLPLVEERLRNSQRSRIDPSFDWKPPNDLLQWVIESCYDTKDPRNLDAAQVAHRLLIINMTAIHATSFTMANVILDLFSSPPENGFVDGIREQCDRVLAEAKGNWTKDAVSGLTLADSAIKESMRHSVWGVIALSRTVSAPDGIKMDGDVHLPQGTRLAFPIHSIHFDEDFYPNASLFDAFRFSRSRKPGQANDSTTSMEGQGTNQASAGTERQDDSQSTATWKQESLVTTRDTFLGFGHGKLPCPGRHFAAHEMKLILAHIVQNYEVEHLAARPLLKAVMETKVPSETTEIRIRRRT